MSKDNLDSKVIQHVFVNTTLTAYGTFTYIVDVPFIPSKMIIRYCNYFNDGTEASISMIRCNGLIKEPGSFMGAIVDNSSVFSKSVHKMGYPVNGQYLFEIVTPSGAIDTGRAGALVMNLEFHE